MTLAEFRKATAELPGDAKLEIFGNGEISRFGWEVDYLYFPISGVIEISSDKLGCLVEDLSNEIS